MDGEPTEEEDMEELKETQQGPEAVAGAQELKHKPTDLLLQREA